MPPTSDTLNRFHRVLLQEISESRPEYLGKPFTVAEIYQNLVPYRSHRDFIGVEMNGDYEDILLRLLAGEGDYLLLDSEVVRREIQQELESPNPNTGLFRDFAAADVRLNPDRIQSDASDTGGAFPGDAVADEGAMFPAETEELEPEVVDIAGLGPDEDGGDAAAPAGDDGVIDHIELADVGFPAPTPGTEAEALDAQDQNLPEAPSVPDTPDTIAEDAGPSDEPLLSDDSERSDEPEESDKPEQSEESAWSGEIEESGEIASPVASDEHDPSACHWCRQNLPNRELLNFCPFCGSDLRLFPCPKCGEELEPRWQFCVSCGTGVSE